MNIVFPRNLLWVVRYIDGKQVREEVRGETAAVKRLVSLNEPDSYLWTPNASAIDLRQAKAMAG